MSRSTAHRYMTTLVALGFLEQGPSRKYRLGIKGSDFGRAMLDGYPLCIQARPHLHELRRQVSYTVAVAILEGDSVRVLERLPGHRGHARLGRAIGAGSRLPAHCTGLGKALLANLPESESEAIVRALKLNREGPKTIRRKGEFSRELLQIREVGFAVRGRGACSRRPVGSGTASAPATRCSAPSTSQRPYRSSTAKPSIELCGPHLLAASERIAAALDPTNPRRSNDPTTRNSYNHSPTRRRPATNPRPAPASPRRPESQRRRRVRGDRPAWWSMHPRSAPRTPDADLSFTLASPQKCGAAPRSIPTTCSRSALG